jgi:hypothetical protein
VVSPDRAARFAAILDRLAERAEVFHLEGTSYRETHRRPARKVTPA